MSKITPKERHVKTKFDADPEKREEELLRALGSIAYERNGNTRSAWMPDNGGQYCKVALDLATDALAKAGVTEPKETIYKACSVDSVLSGLMLPAGIYRLGEDRVLIARHGYWIESIAPEPDSDLRRALEFNPLGEILLRVLNHGQFERLLLWIANARRRLTEWRDSREVRTFCPALCLLGSQGSGKTLIISVLKSLIGPTSDISAYMRGDSAFLPDVQTTPLLVADDAQEGLSTFQRRRLNTQIKAFTASEGVAINRKYREPLTLRLPWSVIIATNTADSLPLYDDADSHKYLILYTPHPLAMTQSERERVTSAMRDRETLGQMLGLIASMTERLLNTDFADHTGRQMVSGWVHDTAAKALKEEDPCEAVGDAISQAILKRPEFKEGDLADGITMRRLRQMVLAECPHAIQRKLPPTPAKFKAAAEKWLAQQGIIGQLDRHGVKIYDIKILRNQLKHND